MKKFLEWSPNVHSPSITPGPLPSKENELRSTWSSAPAGVHSPPSSRSPNASRVKDGNQSSARFTFPAPLSRKAGRGWAHSPVLLIRICVSSTSTACDPGTGFVCCFLEFLVLDCVYADPY